MVKSLAAVVSALLVCAGSGAAHAGPTRFASKTTSLARCKAIEPSIDGDGPVRCRGVGGYQVRMDFAAVTTEIEVRRGDRAIALSTDGVPATLEWRLAGGKPFAIIARLTSETDDGEPSHAIAVRGLGDFESLRGDFPEKDGKDATDALRRARAFADAGHASPGGPGLAACTATATPELATYVDLKIPGTYWVDVRFKDDRWSPARDIPAQKPTGLDLRNAAAFPILARLGDRSVRATVKIELAPIKSRTAGRMRDLYLAQIQSLCAPGAPAGTPSR